MTELDLEAIEARLVAATPGPWRYDGYSEIDQLTDAGKGYPLDCYPDSRIIVEERECPNCRMNVCAKMLDADAEFIAAAPEDIRALLDEVRRLRAGYEPYFPQFCTATDSSGAECGVSLPCPVPGHANQTGAAS